jgi:hypothetical protein
LHERSLRHGSDSSTDGCNRNIVDVLSRENRILETCAKFVVLV